MPIMPMHGGDPMPLEAPGDVAVLVGHLERRDREPAWLADHFAYLAGTSPDWFRPFQEQVLADVRWDVSFDDQCVLLAGAPDRCVETLAGRLRERWSGHDAWALAAIGSEAALTVLAELARAGRGRDEFEHAGFWFPPSGPAQRRFTPERRQVLLEPGDLPGAANPVGLPVAAVVRDPESSPVAWHYVSLRLSEIPGLPPFPAERAHLVAPASYDLWTLFADIDTDGRYHGEQVEYRYDEGPEEDHDVDDPDFGVGQVTLRPYGPDLVYSNGRPGAIGTAGGPPPGIYPNPSCPACNRMMFHAATVDAMIREHGDGQRSVYLCEDCTKLAITATGWN